MSFKDIYCQDRAVSLLQRAYSSDHAAHAYIFSGVEGIGKFKCACEWSKLLLCENPLQNDGIFDACGQCQSCRLWQGDSHPDFNHVYKELLEFTEKGKGKSAPLDLPIDVIREFLIEKITLRPVVSRKKVFVVSESEKLNKSSQNALLKILEEPPGYCCIVLLCTRLDKLLPTIRSRAQVIRFGPLDESVVSDYLIKKGLDPDKAVYFARLSQGSMGISSRWADLELAGASLYETKQQAVAKITGLTLAGTLDCAQWLLEKAKDLLEFWVELDSKVSEKDLKRRTQKIMVQIVISVLDDAVKIDMPELKHQINRDQVDLIRSFAGKYSADRLTDMIKDCYEAMHWIESGVNERLIFERLLLRMADSGIIHAI